MTGENLSFLFSMKGGDVDKKVMFSHKKEGKG